MEGEKIQTLKKVREKSILSGERKRMRGQEKAIEKTMTWRICRLHGTENKDD
jgi:hypothetical protein